jgi:hypothetical protein
LHALQRPPLAPVERVGPHELPPDDVLVRLCDAAADGYSAAFPDAELVTFTAVDIGFLFDHSTNAERASRTVAAWAHVRAAPSPRDRSRQAGFPLPAALAEAGYERGHLIAHASGGGLDANVFAQARHVNQGWSPDGRRYRQLERLAAANPGSPVFHRLIYGDETDVPDLNELTVIVDGTAHHGTFDNRPTAWTSPTGPMRRGRRFHHQVQAAFLLGLTGASAYPEHHVRLTRTSRGRVDLHVVPDVGDRYAVVIEIKSTDWDAFPEHRVRPNLRSHIRQLQGYLDRYVDDMGTASDHDDNRGSSGGVWNSVTGVLLYPRRPPNTARLQLIEDLTSREAIMVAWYDETDWTNLPQLLPTSHRPLWTMHHPPAARPPAASRPSSAPPVAPSRCSSPLVS